MYELLATVLLALDSAVIEGSLDMLRVEVAQRRIKAEPDIVRLEMFADMKFFLFSPFTNLSFANIFITPQHVLIASMQIKKVNNVGNTLQP